MGSLSNWVKRFSDLVEDNSDVGCISDSINTILSYLYGRLGNIEKSRESFDKIGDIGKRNVVAWNSIIGAYVKNGSPVEALDLFKVMIEYPHINPNHVTKVSVLSACSQVGDIDVGISVHEYFKSRGREDILRSNSLLATSMIDMYTKCGNLTRAKEIFNPMLSKDTIYNAMIMGLAVNGQGHEALNLFSKMLSSGSRANAGTFIDVLSACSHSELLDTGRKIFQDMEKKFSVSPQIEHYASYIDLLSRVGCIEEALDIAKSMPFKPNNFIWGALVGGCQLHFKGKSLTQDICKRLIEVDPENSGGYVMLSNALAYDCEWSEVSGLRRVMKEKGVKKFKGCSWISVDGIVHEFLAGPCSHPDIESICSVLDRLLKKMKVSSYGVFDAEQILV